MLHKMIVVPGYGSSPYKAFNGRVKPAYSFTAEDEDFFNSGGMYGVSMGMYGADGFTNFIGAIVPGILAQKAIRKKRATQYAQNLDNQLRAQYPDSDIPQVMAQSIQGLKAELEKQKSLRARAKKKGEKMEYDEGVQVAQDLLNYYQGKAAAYQAQPVPRIEAGPVTGDVSRPVPDAVSAPIIPTETTDRTLGTAIVPGASVGPMAPAGQAVASGMTAESAATAAPAKKKVSPWLLAGGAALLLVGGYFAFRKKR